MSLEIHVRYYAALREQAGRGSETVLTEAGTAAELYRELGTRYGFTLDQRYVRASVNGEIRAWPAGLVNGDAVAFLPPVAGG